MNNLVVGILISMGLVLFAAIVGFAVWGIQSRMNAKRAAKLKSDDADALERKELREGIAEDLAEGMAELVDRVKKLEVTTGTDAQTLALLKQDMLPVSEFMKRKLVDALLHPSEEFIIPDEVLRRVIVPGKPLSESEYRELTELVNVRVNSHSLHVTELEKLQAQALPLLVRIAEIENEMAPTSEITEVRLVTTISKSPDSKKREEAATERRVKHE